MRHTRSNLLTIASAFVLAALHLSWLTACAWPERVAGVIHEDPAGVVYLEEVGDLAFKASHPIRVEQETMVKLLDGIRIEQPVGSSARTTASGPTGPAAFSKEQIHFLGPLLTAALSRAKPEHRVVFRSVEPGSSPPRVTAGVLYAHESTLYVTLTHLRDQAEKGAASKASSALPPSSSVARHVWYFVPDAAGRLADRLPPGAPDLPLLATLAVDVGKLAQPAPSAANAMDPGAGATTPKQAAAGPAEPQQAPELAAPAQIEAAAQAYRTKLKELQDANRLLGQRMAEHRALQEDLRILREKLAEHRALIDRIKATPKKKR